MNMDKAAQLKELVSTHYDIGVLTNYRQLNSGFVNLSYIIETVTNNKKRKYFLRQYQRAKEKGILFEHSVIKHLAKKKFDLVPGLIYTRDGKTLIEQVASDGESIFFAMFAFLSGESRYTWVNPDCSDQDLRQSAVALARYHNAVYDLIPDGQRVEPKIIELLPTIVKSFSDYAENAGTAIFDTFFLENSQSILEATTHRISAIDNGEIEKLPQFVIHCDYHPGNLKFQNGEVIGLFDFDWSKVDIRCFDVAHAIMYFCTAWEGDRDGDLQLDKAAIFLGVYQNTLMALGGLKAMSRAELEYVPHMISASNIYILYWTISDFYTKEENPTEYLLYLKHGIRGVDWFEKRDNWTQLKQMMSGFG